MLRIYVSVSVVSRFFFLCSVRDGADALLLLPCYLRLVRQASFFCGHISRHRTCLIYPNESRLCACAHMAYFQIDGSLWMVAIYMYMYTWKVCYVYIMYCPHFLWQKEMLKARKYPSGLAALAAGRNEYRSDHITYKLHGIRYVFGFACAKTIFTHHIGWNMRAHTHTNERAYSALLSLSLSLASSLSVHATLKWHAIRFIHLFPQFLCVFVFTLPFYPYSHYTPSILSLFLQFISHFHSLSLHYCLFAAFLLSLDYVLARFVHGPRLGPHISVARLWRWWF